MRKSLLFISCNRIGYRVEKTGETESYTISVLEQVPEHDYIDEVAAKLADFDVVVAYASYRGFERFAGLMSQHRGKLLLVACTCGQARRIGMLNRLGIAQTEVFWTKDCGGTTKLAKMHDYLVRNNSLPDS